MTEISECSDILRKFKDQKITLEEFNLQCAIFTFNDDIWQCYILKEFPHKPQCLLDYEQLSDREKEKYIDVLGSQEVRDYYYKRSSIIAHNSGSYYWLVKVSKILPKDDSYALHRQMLEEKIFLFGSWLSANTKLQL